jgi:hypothetical protein
MTAGLLIEYTPAVSQRRRIRFEPRREAVGYVRIEEVWDDGDWRCAGQEVVTNLQFSLPGT